jgi:hypothetical protein
MNSLFVSTLLRPSLGMRRVGALAIGLALLTATLRATEAPSATKLRTWQAPDSDASFTLKSELGVKSGESVRVQLARVLGEWSEQPVLPIKAGRTTLHNLPTYYLQLILADGTHAKSVTLFSAFAEKETFVGAVISTDEVTLDYIADHTELSGEPNTAANEVLDDIVQRSEGGMADLKEVLLAKHHAAWNKFREGIRLDEQAVALVRNKRGDLANDERNADALNRRLRECPPARIYGWGAHRLSDTEHSVTFIYELNNRTITLVWLVDSAKSTTVNISTKTKEVEALRTEKKLNLPSSGGLMAYDAAYDMTSFRNSDYYRGRGTDQLNRPIK